MKGIRAPKPEPAENHIYNPSQIIELFRAVEGDRIELAVHLAVYLGLRRGEICGLRWENVDLVGCTVRIVDNRTMAGGIVIDGPVKSNTSERRLKIPDGLMPVLLAAETKRESRKRELGARYANGGYVFCYQNGRPYRPNYLSLLFAQMLEQHGLPHIRFHDLRHTHGSIAILGAPLYDVSKSLGHSRQDITQKIYIKDLTDIKSAAVDSVDGALKAALADAHARTATL
jgi:integrase